MRILGIDPGEKRIGVAISDPSGTIANPHSILKHVSRIIDAATIANLATQNEVGVIVVGQTVDEDNQPTSQGRHAARLAAAITQQTSIKVVLWDEADSTKAARNAHIKLGGSRRSRKERGHGHLDDLAATYILQTYLDNHPSSGTL